MDFLTANILVLLIYSLGNITGRIDTLKEFPEKYKDTLKKRDYWILVYYRALMGACYTISGEGEFYDTAIKYIKSTKEIIQEEINNDISRRKAVENEK